MSHPVQYVSTEEYCLCVYRSASASLFYLKGLFVRNVSGLAYIANIRIRAYDNFAFLPRLYKNLKLLRLLDAGKLQHDFEMYKKQSGFLGLC